ncbi:MAG TPA: hypothetical protein VJJ23_00770 [Candidatus Nanoarchaeia archaeon]|nr:hypothetical protein [Candidatus Nanoarchaeia archaeon]
MKLYNEELNEGIETIRRYVLPVLTVGSIALSAYITYYEMETSRLEKKFERTVSEQHIGVSFEESGMDELELFILKSDRYYDFKPPIVETPESM